MKLLALLALLPLTSQAATTISDTWIVNHTVPDNNPIGLSDTRILVSEVTSIESVEVSLDLFGGWAGDLYAYLSHGSGFSVLLNRPGRTAAVDEGSGVVSMLVQISDLGVSDIHTALPSSGTAIGMFQPDGRNIDPALSLDTTPRAALFDSFYGLDASGSWTLYIADVASGDTMTLNSWSLKVSGVPEPSVAMMALLGSLCLGYRRR
jgi:subtilisin-like proprotein convertase family protein